MFLLGRGGADLGSVYRFTLTTGFDVSTATFEDSFDVKRTKQDLDEANNKSKDLDEIIKDAINCVNGR